MIKAILIDVDNTLLDFNKCAAFSMRSVAKESGIILPQNIDKIFHEVNDSLWREIEKGKLTREKLHEIRWEIIFNKLNVNYNPQHFEKDFVYSLRFVAIPVDGALELIDYLKAKYPLYIASNASAEQQRIRLKNSNLTPKFKDIFLSEEIGKAKPTKEFFDFCLSKINANRNEIFMIGDSLSADIIGARNYGLKTIWYNHNNIPIPKEKSWDYNVSKLLEIKNIL